MANHKALFGWKAVFSCYSLKDFCKDAAIPFVVSIVLCISTLLSKKNIYELLDSVLNIGISITPVMVTLIVAAYTIILSFLMSDKVCSIKKDEYGKKFMKSLNSSFAIALFFSLLAIIVMIVCRCIYDMHIPSVYANVLNYAAYFIISFLLVFSVNVLYGIVIDIFNSGQTALF